MASDLWTYIEEIISIELSEEEVLVVGRRIATYCMYLGLKDATQKIIFTSNNPGPWTLSMITPQQNKLFNFLDEVKWENICGVIECRGLEGSKFEPQEIRSNSRLLSLRLKNISIHVSIPSEYSFDI